MQSACSKVLLSQAATCMARPYILPGVKISDCLMINGYASMACHSSLTSSGSGCVTLSRWPRSETTPPTPPRGSRSCAVSDGRAGTCHGYASGRSPHPCECKKLEDPTDPTVPRAFTGLVRPSSPIAGSV